MLLLLDSFLFTLKLIISFFVAVCLVFWIPNSNFPWAFQQPSNISTHKAIEFLAISLVPADLPPGTQRSRWVFYPAPSGGFLRPCRVWTPESPVILFLGLFQGKETFGSKNAFASLQHLIDN